MIPERDRIGQIRAFSTYLKEIFGTQVRGMWVAERVWEQHLVTAIVDAGIEYTVLDDFHFSEPAAPTQKSSGYYLTEDDGRLLKVFPAARDPPLQHAVSGAACDLRIPGRLADKPAGLDGRLRRRRRKVRDAGPEHSITFTHMDGWTVSATCSRPIATGSRRRRSRRPSIDASPGQALSCRMAHTAR